ncbi:AMP-dependent synthetase/ligase [Alkalitalea saponilacus]|uniref:Long-chain acyl-CoA synthetase n=1 Tax=Alkalitalea saponilacus TaxID=889453 RepID=A0A1T5HTW7_9BACT|nr:AMP-binding protein [Alkalitalea saponilacus]ASB50207.1 long-chain fatty acid--CoA ligase [Alkalitalea saponilacus]SKC23940.1 long-chain acyl-CoA synthetase [Alkalitalea saponilacus]
MLSIIDYFEDKTSQFGNNPLIWEKRENIYESTSYNESLELIKTYAAGLMGIGFEKGDRVSLLSEGRRDWLIAELSILYAAGINVPLSTKLEESNDLVFRINHSDSKIIIVSAYQLPKIRNIINLLPGVEKVIILDEIEDLQTKEILWSDLYKSGVEFRKTDEDKLKNRRNEITPNDVANISYTSGTTADPKGIMLSHRNYTANVEQAFSFIDIPSHYRTLVVLPWDHAFAHTAALYAFMYRGASVAAVKSGRTPNETLKNFVNNMQEIQPHVLMSVPALAKNFRKNIEKGVRDKGKIAWLLFSLAIKHAFWYNGTGDNKGKGIKKLTKPIGNLFDKILFRKIRLKFGGNLKFFIGGGALLDIELQKFFYAIGIPMYQGYGLSEAAPIISANTPDFHKMGSSGKVVHNLELKICDENGREVNTGESGEIVVKGENVMLGYWKNKTATAETIKDEWLYTGDLGYVDNENYLYVKGRFKSLLISHDGEKYSPEGIEEAIIDHCPLIDQFMLYNNQSPYTIGLAVPNSDSISNLLKNHEFQSDEEKSAFILRAIQEEINQFKQGGKLDDMFPQRWLPTTVGVCPEPFTEVNKMLNSTMKMVRRVVETKLNKEINHLYTPEGKDMFSTRNRQNIMLYLTKPVSS